MAAEAETRSARHRDPESQSGGGYSGRTTESGRPAPGWPVKCMIGRTRTRSLTGRSSAPGSGRAARCRWKSSSTAIWSPSARIIVADGTLQDMEFNVKIARKAVGWRLRILPSSHTNPVFVLVGGKPIRASKRSAEWCLKGVDQCWSQKEKYIAPAEMKDAKEAYEHAREAYRKILAEGRRVMRIGHLVQLASTRIPRMQAHKLSTHGSHASKYARDRSGGDTVAQQAAKKREFGVRVHFRWTGLREDLGPARMGDEDVDKDLRPAPAACHDDLQYPLHRVELGVRFFTIFTLDESR